MGLTGDEEQIRGAVETYDAMEHVIGFKLYAGHSFGRIPRKQYWGF